MPVKKTANGPLISTGGGSRPAGTCYAWAKEAEERGAGEILFTSMNHDGTKDGFACDAIARLIRSRSPFLSLPQEAPVTMEHFAEVFTRGKADAGLAASIFHFREITVPQLKDIPEPAEYTGKK